ncbi:hypothetical protein E4U49_005909 [Claviceps purpurea]|nr:hypothetical protein E4U49_005909 [Claviceps purpurea]
MISKDRIEAAVAAFEAVDALVIPQGAGLVDLIVKENRDRHLGSPETTVASLLIVVQLPATCSDAHCTLGRMKLRDDYDPGVLGAVLSHGPAAWAISLASRSVWSRLKLKLWHNGCVERSPGFADF